MSKRFIIIVGFVVLTVILVGLNLLSYTQQPTTEDSEDTPNRSTYNSAPSGTLGLFLLLKETGSNVERWQKSPSELLLGRREPVTVFIVIGPLKKQFSKEEIRDLYKWVEAGGRLVVIDRYIPENLRRVGKDWKIAYTAPPYHAKEAGLPAAGKSEIDPDEKARPTQPSPILSGVSKVQPSRNARKMLIQRGAGPDDDFLEMDPDDSIAETGRPVELLRVDDYSILVETGYGKGSIALLGDSFITSNGGIRFDDNMRLAVNLARAGGGTIVFDEYHHGYRADGNELLAYFSDTPVISLSLQFSLIVVLFLFARSLRFARALPEQAPNRLSKLEYVSAVAELQRQTDCYDLAMQNIYGEFRRRTARVLGIDLSEATPEKLASLIADRMNGKASEIAELLTLAEEISEGRRTGRGETLGVVQQIRSLEKSLRT